MAKSLVCMCKQNEQGYDLRGRKHSKQPPIWRSALQKKAIILTTDVVVSHDSKEFFNVLTLANLQGVSPSGVRLCLQQDFPHQGRTIILVTQDLPKTIKAHKPFPGFNGEWLRKLG